MSNPIKNNFVVPHSLFRDWPLSPWTQNEGQHDGVLSWFRLSTAVELGVKGVDISLSHPTYYRRLGQSYTLRYFTESSSITLVVPVLVCKVVSCVVLAPSPVNLRPVHTGTWEKGKRQVTVWQLWVTRNWETLMIFIGFVC